MSTDTNYTGPVGPSKEEWEKWYHRFKDVCTMARTRNRGIVCHPQERAMLIDMLDRVAEDDTFPFDHVPPLVVTNRMKQGDIQLIEVETAKILTFAEANRSNKGFGRYKGLIVPGREGINNPWSLEGKSGISVLEADAPGRKMDPLN